MWHVPKLGVACGLSLLILRGFFWQRTKDSLRLLRTFFWLSMQHQARFFSSFQSDYMQVVDRGVVWAFFFVVYLFCIFTILVVVNI